MRARHAMEVTIEPGYRTTTFRAKCSDPAADCHYICAEGCESWGEIVRNEDGRVLHHLSAYAFDSEIDSPPHRMEYVEECNFVPFLDESDDPTEDMTGEPFTFTIPAVFTYACEAVTWEVAS